MARKRVAPESLAPIPLGILGTEALAMALAGPSPLTWRPADPLDLLDALKWYVDQLGSQIPGHIAEELGNRIESAVDALKRERERTALVAALRSNRRPRGRPRKALSHSEFPKLPEGLILGNVPLPKRPRGRPVKWSGEAKIKFAMCIDQVRQRLAAERRGNRVTDKEALVTYLIHIAPVGCKPTPRRWAERNLKKARNVLRDGRKLVQKSAEK